MFSNEMLTQIWHTEVIASTLMLTLAWQLFRLGLPQVIALWINVGLILPNVLLEI